MPLFEKESANLDDESELIETSSDQSKDRRRDQDDRDDDAGDGRDERDERADVDGRAAEGRSASGRLGHYPWPSGGLVYVVTVEQK